MRGGGASSQRGLYLATIAMIVVAVALLAQLLRRFEADLQTNVQGLQRVLSDETLLRNPSDPYVRFGLIEDIAGKYAEHPYLREMTITKFFREREDVIYPFYWPALRAAGLRETGRMRHPDPAAPGSDVIMAPLVARGQLLGHLYVRVDRSAVRGVQLAIASFILILVGFVWLFLSQFRRQEAVISRTTIELEEKRRELVRLERLALAGQLSASLLHDLRKPVLNIKNELDDLLATADALPAPVRSEVAALQGQTRLFFDMLREGNLERFVRSEGEKEYVDVHEALKTSLGLVHYERGQVDVVLDLAAQAPLVFAQPVHLVQVFSNLILNAYQAMGGKGHLTIRTRREEDRVVVEFSDTGPGIPPGKLEQIFTPFFSTKPADKGTGLGLYISREIVRQLGGEILAESFGTGTTFRVVLPAA